IKSNTRLFRDESCRIIVRWQTRTSRLLAVIEDCNPLKDRHAFDLERHRLPVLIIPVDVAFAVQLQLNGISLPMTKGDPNVVDRLVLKNTERKVRIAVFVVCVRDL